MRPTDENYAALVIAVLYPQELGTEDALVTAGFNVPRRSIVRNNRLLDREAQQMLALRQRGYTWQDIGEQFGIPSKGAAQKRVRRYLERRAECSSRKPSPLQPAQSRAVSPDSF